MNHDQALDAAIVAAELDPRNPAVRKSWQAGIEKYLEVRNSEAVAWQYAIGGDEWDLAADATEATRRRDFGLDVRPLFPAPSAGGETVKVKRLIWQRNFAHTDLGLFYMLSDYDGGAILEKVAGSSTMKSAWPSVEEAKAEAQADYERRIRTALVSHPPQSTPVDSQNAPALEDKGGDAFAQIVSARKAVIDATAAYNARLSVARAERDRGNWSIKVDPEYHAMCDAQSAFHRIVQDLADAALSTAPEPTP